MIHTPSLSVVTLFVSETFRHRPSRLVGVESARELVLHEGHQSLLQ